MTARELYDCDLRFRGFFDSWNADRRCPLAMVDYLLDLDMPEQAERARWAATMPDRPVWHSCQSGFKGSCGPYPVMGPQREQHHYWWWIGNADDNIANLIGPQDSNWDWALPDPDNPTDALIALLDNLELPAGVTA